MSDELYTKLGLTPEATQVYIILVSKQVRTREEIELLSEGMSKESLEAGLSQLQQKGFIRVVPGNVPQYIALAPPITVTSEIDQQIDAELNAIQEDVHSRYKKSEEKLIELIKYIQDSQRLYTTFQEQLLEHLKTHLSRLEEKSTINQDKFASKVGEYKKAEITRLDKSFSDFEKEIETVRETQTATFAGEIKTLQDRKNDEEVEFKARSQEIYQEKVEGLRRLISQLEQGITSLSQQLTSTTTSLNSSLTTISDQTKRNIDNLKQSGQTELESLLLDISSKIGDKNSIFTQQIQVFQGDITGQAEDLNRNLQELKDQFQAQTSSKELGKLARSHSEEFTSKFKQVTQATGDVLTSLSQIQTSFGGIGEKLRSQLNTDLNETIHNIQTQLGISQDNVLSTLTETTGGLGQHITMLKTTLHPQIKNEITEVNSALTDSLTEIATKISKLNSDISDLLIAIQDILSQDSAVAIHTVAEDLKKKIQALNQDLTSRFNKEISTIQAEQDSLSESFDATSAALNTGLYDIQTGNHELLTTSKDKIHESVDYLKRVADEEFSSFAASAEMMLGQMQATITENVSTATEEIAQETMNVVNQIVDHLTHAKEAAVETVTEFRHSLQESVNNGSTAIQEAIEDDIKNLKVKVASVTEKTIQEKEIQLEESSKQITEIAENLEKGTLELSRNVPSFLSDFQARHTDSLNTLERTVKAELNKIGSRFQEIDQEVTGRKKVKAELISKIVKAALTEYQAAQKRTERMIDEQIENFGRSSEELAETINTSLNRQNITIIHLVETVSDQLREFSINSYERAESNLNSFSEQTINRITAQQTSLLEQLGGIQTRSSELGKMMNDTLEQQFDLTRKDVQQLNLSTRIKEVESTMHKEIESFIQNILLAFQSACDSGGARISEVVDENVLNHIDTAFEEFQEITDLESLKEDLVTRQEATSRQTQQLLSKLLENFSKHSSHLSATVKETLDDLNSLLEESQNQRDTVVNTKIQDMIETQSEKVQSIQSSLGEKTADVSTRIEQVITNMGQNINQTLDLALNTFNEAVIQSRNSLSEKFNHVTKVPLSIHDTVTNVDTLISDQIQTLKKTMGDQQDDLKKQLTTLDHETASLRQTFLAKISKLTTEIDSHDVDLIQGVQAIIHRFPEYIESFNNTISQATETFNTDFLSLFFNLDEDIKPLRKNLIERNTQIYDDFNSSLDSFIADSQNFLSTFTAQEENLLNLSRTFADSTLANSVKLLMDDQTTLIKSQETLFSQISQNLATTADDYSQHIKSTLHTLMDSIRTRISEVKDFISEIGTTYDSGFSSIFTSTLTTLETEVQQINETLTTEADRVMAKINERALKSEEMILTDFKQLIEAIPIRIGSGLTRSKSLMSAVSDVQQLALEIPVASTEETYMKLISIDSIFNTLEAMLARTKSGIQIMLPRLSMIDVNLLKAAGTRKRIQILTNVDGIHVDEIKDMGNVQLKHYSDVEVFAFARDGDEELALGTGDSKDLHLIMTTNSALVTVLKNIMTDLWPRGRSV